MKAPSLTIFDYWWEKNMKTDELLKLELYKTQIMKEFIAKAHYPTQSELKTALDALDLKESCFKVVPVAEGETFNTRVFNAQTEALGNDLTLLYQLLRKLTQERIDYLSQFADTSLTDLEQKLEDYLAKSRLEIQSSDLGHTVYFAHAPFTGEQFNEYFTIDCGNLALTNGASVHLLMEGHNLEYARLALSAGEETVYLAPYALNRQSFQVPGTLQINETTVTCTTVPKPNESVLIPYENLNTAYDYVLLTGKGQVALKAANQATYSPYSQCICYEQTMIDFYVKDAVSLQIRVNQTPLYTNYDFSQEAIKLEKGIHHFYLEMPPKSIVEIFLEGGSLYAQKGKGIIKSGSLYFTHATSFKEFLVLEKTRQQQTNYRAVLQVKSTLEDLGVDTILVKELI